MNKYKISKVTPMGFLDTIDVTVNSKDHLFLANGIVTSNSHAITYGMVTAAELWFKYKYPVQFFTALLNNTDLSAKKMGNDNVFGKYLTYIRQEGIPVRGVDINHSKVGFSTDGKSIYFGIGHVKNIGDSGQAIVDGQPYSSLEDFLSRVKTNARVLKGLLYSGGFDCFGNRNDISQKLAEFKVNKSDEEAASSEATKTEDLRDKATDLLKRIDDARNDGDYETMQSLVKELSKVNRGLEADKRRKEKPKQKKQAEGETHSDEEWDKLEIEYTGLVLSRPPIFEAWKDQISHNEWSMPSTIKEAKRKIIRVFGKLLDVKEKTSKNGNQMHIGVITDGVAEMSFFIFSSTWEHFRNNFMIGDIGVFPMSKFDDGDTRFFTDKAVCTVLKRE